MITSQTNEKIKNLIKLKNPKQRKLTKSFIVEGEHLVLEAKNLGLLIESFTICETIEGTLISEELMKKISTTSSVVKVIGVCKYIEKNEVTNKVLILDKVADPGNLGTLLRSAKAFNFNTVFISTGSVDYYNEKVIRSSQGAIFKLNLLTGDIINFIESLKRDNYAVFGTDVVNGLSLETVSKATKLAIVLGNEGSGISDEVKSILNSNIYIKMNDTESLNVAVCGSIIMHYFNS